MDSSIIGRVRERIGRFTKPAPPVSPRSEFKLLTGELTLDLIGTTEFACGTEPSESVRLSSLPSTHVVYDMSVPAKASFPTDIAFGSIVIRVDEGSVQVMSPGGRATIAVGTGGAIRSDDGTVLLDAGETRLYADVAAILTSGNTVTSTDEALEVMGGAVGAKLLASVVLAVDDSENLCWICPPRPTP